MPRYEIVYFERSIEIEDGEIVEANISHGGTSETRSGSNLALVRRSDDEPPGSENPVCGYEGCQRTVSDPDEHCWQHPQEE